MRIIIVFLIIPCLVQAQSTQKKGFQPAITLTAELTQLTDIGTLPAFVTGAEAQVSTYDTTGGNEDGFNGMYSFVHRNPDSSLVMLDLEGPGELNRIATPTPTNDTLDFYIDGEKGPRLSVNYMDLFSGKQYPFQAPLCGSGAGGHFCYFPILFQRHLRLVSRGKKLQFHQLQYRLFPPDTRVESYDPKEVTRVQRQLAALTSRWQNRTTATPSTSTIRHTINLQPGVTVSIATLTAGGRITGIAFENTTLLADSAANIWLRVMYDGEQQPAIEAPVADFFGFVSGKPSMAGLLLGANNTTAYSNLPMPFDHAAKIEIVYRGTGAPVRVQSVVTYTTLPRDPRREGKLYVHYRSDTLAPSDPYHIFLSTEGKGHYVGTILYANGVQRPGTYFFEGDDSCATDGRMRIHGTGSEDYFNGGWYALPGRWDSARSFPLSGCLLYNEKRSTTGGYRFYLGDKIPFTQTIWMGIEHGPDPAHRFSACYRSLAFYYRD